jgi:glutamyl-tRNA reductase
MRLAMIGISHATAPVAARECLALDDTARARVFDDLAENAGVLEAMVLSTCNRTEIYALLDEQTAHDDLVRALRAGSGQAPADAEEYLFRHCGDDVAEHLFSVVSGLDSMVLGESQIVAQVREAHRSAAEAGLSGKVLDGLLRRALKVGKAVRNRTEIGAGHTSVAGVACDLARKVHDDLDRRTVVLIGAGETGELVVRHLLDSGVGELLIVNRTHGRALALAERLGGEAWPFEQLAEAVGRADVLITSTAAPRPLITSALLARAIPGRQRPLFIIDIAVPRDVSPDVDSIDEVYRYDLDTLSGLVEANLGSRCQALHAAREIVAAEVDKFAGWLRQQAVTPTILQLREQFESVRQLELEKLRSGLSDEDFRQVERATRAMVNRLLHLPTVQIKQAAREAESEPLVKAFRFLLGLDSADAA